MSTFGLGGQPSRHQHSQAKAWSMLKGILLVLAIVGVILAVLFWPGDADAQTAAAPAVRIADAAQPEGVLVDPISCLERAARVFGGKADKAAAYCRELYKQGGGIMKGVANEAANATKNLRPVVVPGYGFGSYVIGGGGGTNLVSQAGGGVTTSQPVRTSGAGGSNVVSRSW